MATLAPCAAKRTAIACPIPDEPPVTSRFLPFRPGIPTSARVASCGLVVVVQFGGHSACEVAVDAVLVGDRVDAVQALRRQPPRRDMDVAARLGLARHGLTDQVQLRCTHRRLLTLRRPTKTRR